MQFIPIINEMEKPNPKRVLGLIYATMGFVSLIYSIDATSGYLTFCNTTLSNILDCYSSTDNLILIARIAFVFTLNFSFPLYSTAIIIAINNQLFGTNDEDYDRLESPSRASRKSALSYADEEVDEVEVEKVLPMRRRVILALLVIGSMASIVSFNPPLDAVLGLTGALGGSR